MIIKFTLDAPTKHISLFKKQTDIKKMKIKKMYYKVATSGHSDLVISLGTLNQKYDEDNKKSYFFYNSLPYFLSAISIYTDNDPEHWDYQGNGRRDINELEFNVYINGSIASDITALNPLILEIEFQ